MQAGVQEDAMAAFEEKKLKKVIEPTLAKAFTHPLRGHVWVVLFEKGEASPTEVADELGLEVNEVSYHFRKLSRRGLIEVVRTEKRRGFDEHFYQPVAPALKFDDAQWMELPMGVRSRFSADLLRHIIESFVDALDAGSFDRRDRHLSRSWLLVDERGWTEAQRVMERALNQLQAIHQRCAERGKDSTRPKIPMSVVLAAFETAASVPVGRAGDTDAL
jgi:DNA-binding transcriptional ArsR family regulator